MNAQDAVPDERGRALKIQDPNVNMGMAHMANEVMKLGQVVEKLTLASTLAVDVKNSAAVGINRIMKEVARSRDLADNATEYQGRTAQAPTVTLIPPQPRAGMAVHDCLAVKTGKLQEYSGHENSAVDCLAWLEKMMAVSRVSNLTHAAIINLLKSKASGMAYEAIHQGVRDGLTLSQLISTFETTFGEVGVPAEMLVRCNTCTLATNESLGVFAIRLRKLAGQAVRDMQDENARKKQEIMICKTNFYRVLPAYLHHYLQEKETVLAQAGRPEMAFHEMVSEVQLRAKQVKARRERETQERERNKPLARSSRGRDFVRQVQCQEDELEEYADPSSQKDSEPSDEEWEEQEVTPEMIRAVQTQRRFFKRKNIYDKTKKNYVRPTYETEEIKRIPGLLAETKPNATPGEMPKLANCEGEPNRCLKCGLITSPPHRMNNSSCVMFGIPLADQACIMCKKGLHVANYCPHSFSSRGKHPADEQNPKNV